MTGILREERIGDCRLILSDCLEVLPEIDPNYFEIACRRVAEAYRQPALFSEAPQPPTQQALKL